MSNEDLIKTGVNALMGVKSGGSPALPTDLAHPRWDKVATLKYIAATLVQIAVLTGLLWGMDGLTGWFLDESLPPWGMTAIACLFFAFVTLRSRLFSPLDNTRNNGRYTALVRPQWAPPPFVFPIVWMSIAVLRVVSAYLVWQTLGQTFLSWPLVLFIVHLSLGDTWNTIFTVEGRLGTAVPVVVLGPFLSAAVVTCSYFQTTPLAGWVILPSCVWLAIASVLCWKLWQLNGQEPLYPLALKA